MDLSYFTGKACSIFTVPINRNFTEKQLIEHFVCFIEQVDESGILGSHPATGRKNFYNLAYVVAIIEEEVVTEPVVEPSPVPKSTSEFVDIAGLAALSQKSKALSQKPASA